jgi:hypothetical protein
MNERIANIIKTQIDGLNFVDKIAGLVRAVKVDVINENNIRVTKTFPVACDVTADECVKGRYQDLIPDSKYKSIVYFEDGGTTMTGKDRDWILFRSNLTLVAWLNLQKIGCNCTYSTAAILSIIASLPEFPINETNGLQQISINVINEVPKSFAIFSKYTYDEKISQFLLSPYDYFALNITADYRINVNCIEQLIAEACTCRD